MRQDERNKEIKSCFIKIKWRSSRGRKKTGFDEATVLDVARQVKEVVDAGVQVAIVIGGGNFWRGRTSENMDRTKADQIGMLATVMNCIYVSDMFSHVGLKTKYTHRSCVGRLRNCLPKTMPWQNWNRER